MKYVFCLFFVCLTNLTLAQTKVNFYTTEGDFTVELREDLMPITAGNFIKLVNTGFYDSLIFHRVIDKFVIQGGDPTGLGNGGPGYSIVDEYHPKMNHDSAGVIAMAKAGPNTAGSQFYLTLTAQPHLDGNYAVFGTCIKGLNVVQKIGSVAVNTQDRPLKDVLMDSVRTVQNSIQDTTATHSITSKMEAFPNPFIEQVTVNYSTHGGGWVTINVYDARGQMVSTLEDGYQTNVIHHLQWHADVPKGVFYLKIQSNSGTLTQKMIKLH